MPKTDVTTAPFAYDGLDRVIHEKARLGLLTSLMAHPKGLAFADLKQLCGLTDAISAGIFRCCRRPASSMSSRVMKAIVRIPAAV